MLSAKEFAVFVKQRAKAGDGYIMGARGQDPKKWSKSSWWFTQYRGAQRTKALYWRAHAERVWDCQGLAEGYINERLGKNIDVRARNNYSSWCGTRGKGTIPAQYRVPGAAVFWGSSAANISHVAYLIEPADPGKPEGDWIIGEARGVMYGVVLTRLSQRKPHFWGLMTKYFEYEAYRPQVYELGDRELARGCKGDDVKELQSMLIDLGFSCGTYGADGDYGSDTAGAVKKFQAAYHLPDTGTADQATIETVMDAFAHEDDSDEAPEPPAEKTYDIDALDLSQHNSASFSKIDWAWIRDHVGFLILRAGVTRVDTAPKGIGPDTYFERYASKCREYGIRFWVYYYARGATVNQARAEAEYLFKIASPYGPVGYAVDIEVRGVQVGAFLGRLAELGASRTMLYIGHCWVPVYNLPVDDEGYIKCCDAVWIPKYGKNTGQADPKYAPKYRCDLWQYTSVASVPAIPDKTLDADLICGRRSLRWFRGEEG